MKSKYFIFDLDDTLVYEIDYLKSAYSEIALSIADSDLFARMMEWYESGKDVFQILNEKYGIKKDILLQQYRMHTPSLTLNEGVRDVLKEIKKNGHFLGLITDGRIVTQRNKLKALGIENLFDKIIISEEIGSSKPSKSNFEAFLNADIDEYFYIGDNVSKDFVTPNYLGWTSICLLDQGTNIHKQNFNLSASYLPKIKIKSISQLSQYIK